jgi:hypothetical protein
MHLAQVITMKNGSVKTLLSLSKTLTSLSCSSDGLALNIDPTSVWDCLISSFPSFPLTATNFDEK